MDSDNTHDGVTVPRSFAFTPHIRLAHHRYADRLTFFHVILQTGFKRPTILIFPLQFLAIPVPVIQRQHQTICGSGITVYLSLAVCHSLD